MKQNKNDFSIEKEDNSPFESNNINNPKNNAINKNEDPSLIIEKLLICIYNKNIKSEKSKKEEVNIDIYINKVKKLCTKYEDYYIILLLLKNIRKLINKYREIIFELPIITEIFQEKLSLNYRERSNSQNNKISLCYRIKNFIRVDIIYRTHKSYPKYKAPGTTIKTLFAELYNIKKCLKKSAPIIHNIFEIPLSHYDKFSIEQCQREEYLNILICDKFISNEIHKNTDPKLNYLLNELTKGNFSNKKLMDEKIEFFSTIYDRKKKFEKLLTIEEIGSNIDERYPEECEPILEEYSFNNNYNYNNYISLEDIKNNYFLSPEEDGEKFYFNILEGENIIENNLSNINKIQFENNININNINNKEENNNIVNDKNININNEIINKIKEKAIEQSKEIKQNIIKKNEINGINNININIEGNNKLLDTQNLFKKNNKKDIINENFEKALKFNTKDNLNNIIDKNINSPHKPKRKYINILNDERIIRDKEQYLFKSNKTSNINNKKENNGNKLNNTNNNKLKVDKKEIPSDIDDLVKYITNDDKKEIQNKKKKKNKKKAKKKNKNEIEANKDKDKDEINIDNEDKKETEKNDEINEIKQNIINNSINRFKIHKIKFKYRPKWLDKIAKYS